MDTAIDLRRERGLQIASTRRIKAVGPVWVVPSQTHNGSYVVRNSKAGKNAASCTCPDFELRRLPCKHVFAVEYARHQVTQPDGTKVVTETLRVTYSQNWPAYNAGQVNEKELVQSLLRGLCAGIAAPEQAGRGRPRLPLSDVVYASVTKGSIPACRADVPPVTCAMLKRAETSTTRHTTTRSRRTLKSPS